MEWAYGDVVLYRFGRQGRAQFVRIGRVISDDVAGLALWIAPGSPQIESVMPDGRGLHDVTIAERLCLPRVRRWSTWRGPGIVMFTPPDAAWSVWSFFDGAGGFAGWYGNLQAPSVRWWADGVRGVDSADRALDVLVAPDRTCSWKDEDEFAALTGQPGRWTADQAPQIRADGEHLMTLATSAAPPFDGRFASFRPDPRWSPTGLPAGWDRPHLADP